MSTQPRHSDSDNESPLMQVGLPVRKSKWNWFGFCSFNQMGNYGGLFIIADGRVSILPAENYASRNRSPTESHAPL